jgi:hypothetical protein
MKKTIKFLFVLIVCIAALATVSVISFAAEKTPLFTVTDADGEVTEYFTASEFVGLLQNDVPDGITITICKDIDLNMGENTAIEMESYTKKKNIYINLAGNGIYNKEKMTMFSVGTNITLNVYSSEPGAYMSTVSQGKGNWGGCIFNISGRGATVNCGTMEINGVTYDGNNVSSFSSCFVNLSGSGTVGYNGVGGNHYAAVADWKGFLCPRTGTGSINFKDTNLVIIDCTQFIHSESADPSISFDNCVIVDSAGKSGKLLNGALASIYFKDCISTFSIISTEASSSATINLEGENIFGSELGFNTALVKNAEGKVLAKTNKELTFVGGATELIAYDRFLEKFTLPAPKLKDACILCDPEDTESYEWIYEDQTATETWHKDSEPTPPFSLSGSAKAGLYKPGWVKKVVDVDSYQMTGGLVADFDIKVAAEYDGYVKFYIFIPAFLVEDGNIDFTALTVDGGVYGKGDWTETEIDGEKYYYATTPYLEEEEIDRNIEFYMPCEFSDKGGKFVEVNTVWNINLSEYVDKVLAEEDKWTDDQIALVEEMLMLIEELKGDAIIGGEDVEPDNNDDALVPGEEEEEY